MNYDLVFEGGGAKGMAFVGAVQEFEAKQNTHNRLLGTSAGAITATLLAAGYSSQEMLAALGEKENGRPIFATFMSDPPEFDDLAIQHSATLALLRSLNLPFVPDVVEDRIDEWLAKILLRNARNFFSLIERGGWYSADNFLIWLRRKLDEGQFQGKRRNFSQMTLTEFYAATGRDLSLVASDTTSGRMLVLNRITTPNLPVVWAVRMSMGIPLVWPEAQWQADWGAYLNKDITGNLIVDGGLLSNFPIELFISEDDYIVEVMGQKQQGDQVLGLLIDESIEVEGAPSLAVASAGGFDLAKLQFIQRLNRLFNTATGAHDKMVLEAFERLVVKLPAKGYSMMEFDMSEDRRCALVAAGANGMKAYLSRRGEASLARGEETFYAVDLVGHAGRVARNILEW